MKNIYTFFVGNLYNYSSVYLQDSLDVRFMRNFFAGLAQCGAWACMDEFNRIEAEVLSVVAQYITSLQEAQRMLADKMDFEGRSIKIVGSFAIFITVRNTAHNSKLHFQKYCLIPSVYGVLQDVSIVFHASQY